MTPTQAPTPPLPPLDDRAVAFLTQECDRMLALYAQAQDAVQSVFNFYLTFVSAVIGAVVVFLQAASGDQTLAVAGILLFAALVGSVYLSALSGRYAHAARYSYAADALRRHLIAHLHIPMPESYRLFMVFDAGKHSKPAAWYLWLSPTGTYQMFIALVNSAALAGVVALVMGAGQAEAWRTWIGIVLVFFSTLWIFNGYSRLVIRRFSSAVSISLDDDAPAWASRI